MREQFENHRKRQYRILMLLITAAIFALCLLYSRKVYAASEIRLSKSSLALIEGESAKLKLKGAKASKVKWRSSDESVATVTAKGKVAAIGCGTCKITAKYKKKSYSCSVEVESLLVEEETISVVRGRQYLLRVNSEKASPSWMSSNPAVATVTSKGLVEGVTPGLALVTASWRGYTASCYVVVLNISSETLVHTKKAKLANQGKILLAGSSSMDLWFSAPQAFSPYEVINMAIGGTRVIDWLEWYPKMIVRYKPTAVVLYVGANDLANGNLITGKENAANTIRLLTGLHNRMKDVPVYYIGICPCWLRSGAWAAVAESNGLVRDFCSKTENVNYIDLPSKVILSDGTPNPGLFRADKLHPNASGYLLWKTYVAEPVKKDVKKLLKKKK